MAKYPAIYYRNRRKLKARLKGEVTETMTCHHIILVSLGGGHDIRNLCFMEQHDHEEFHYENPEPEHDSPAVTRARLKQWKAKGIDLV